MPKKKQLGTVLRERKHISESALEHALEEQKYKLAMLGEILLASGKVAKPDLIAALEEVSGVHYLDLEITPVDPELLERLPRETAERHCAIPVSRNGPKIRVAMSRPQDLAVVDELRFRLGAEIEPRLAFREEILAAIAKYYSPRHRGRILQRGRGTGGEHRRGEDRILHRVAERTARGSHPRVSEGAARQAHAGGAAGLGRSCPGPRPRAPVTFISSNRPREHWSASAWMVCCATWPRFRWNCAPRWSRASRSCATWT